MKAHQDIARAAGVIGGATLVSRLLGYVRDMIVGSLFGAGPATDAFIAAYRIPNYLRRIFGEGTLNSSFVPVFTETLDREGRDKAWELANVVMTLISSLLTVLVILGIIFTPAVVRAIAPGFTENPSQFALTVLLTRVTFPFAVFVGLAAAFMGILNSLKHFGSPAIAPALLNIAMILSALLLTPHLQTPILSLSIGVLVGGILQLLVQVPFLLGKRFRFALRFDFRHPGMRRIVRLMGPGIIGQSVLQINLFISTVLASLLPVGSITYLFFADRLVQFPLGIFGISVATALLPTLSVSAANNNAAEMVETLSKTMRMVLFLMIPSMVGLVVLRTPIVSTLFQRGSFDYHATQGTAAALMYYAFGLWAFAEVKVVAQTFYAMQDTWTPMKVAAAALLVNIVLSLVLMKPMHHAGLALANSLASMLNVGALVWVLRARMGRLGGMRFLGSAVKITLASLIMGIAAYYGAKTGLWSVSGNTVHKFFYLARGILFGMASYVVICMVLRVEEFKTMGRWLFKSGSQAVL